MNEYEKHCVEVLAENAFWRFAASMPNTMWKYTKKIMMFLTKYDIVNYISLGIRGCNQFQLNDEYFKGLEGTGTCIEKFMQRLPQFENLLLENENFPKFIKYMEKYLSTPKYILKDTINITVNNVPKKLYEICANKPFVAYKNDGTRSIIPKGQSGGYIESEQNLSQEGSCWIGFGNNVCDNALITGNAYVGGGSSKIRGNVIIKDNAICHNSFIQDNVIIANNSVIKTSCIKDNVEIFGNSIVKDSDIFGNVWIENALIENKQLKDNEKIKGQEVNCSDRY